MRTCPKCQTPMEENYTLKSDNFGTLRIVREAGKSDQIKVAFCPKCGEVSLYITERP